MSVHVAADELADAAAGLLDSNRIDEVAEHLASCPRCREAEAGLRRVSERLAAAPKPPMPAGVAARLQAVIEQERVRRATVRAEVPAGWRRPTLGPLTVPASRSRGRLALSGLAAAALAALVGFGGYLASATAGMDEPPVAVVAVDSDLLARQAEMISSSSDLEPHRFSRAWSCAVDATEGRIIGLAPAVVDGVDALLVYTEAGPDTAQVTVVTGCDAGQPAPGQSSVVSR